MKRKPERYYLSTDSKIEKDCIARLIEADIVFTRPTQYQMKYREFNFYPKKGTITIDPTTTRKHQTVDDFIDLIKSTYLNF